MRQREEINTHCPLTFVQVKRKPLLCLAFPFPKSNFLKFFLLQHRQTSRPIPQSDSSNRAGDDLVLSLPVEGAVDGGVLNAEIDVEELLQAKGTSQILFDYNPCLHF